MCRIISIFILTLVVVGCDDKMDEVEAMSYDAYNEARKCQSRVDNLESRIDDLESRVDY
jgi:PBP1b-binding outer membrane lipoprotein LpoB